MDTKNLLEAYIERFEEKPPRLITTHYENEIYQNLMKIALERNSPITCKEVEDAFDEVQYDVYRCERKPKLMIIDNEKLVKTVKYFITLYERDQNGRYKSYDYVRSFFLDNRKNKTNSDLMALHLYSYLASWGMLRNSFLMQKDYLFNKGLVEEVLYNSDYDELMNFDQYDDYDNHKVELITKLIKDIRSYYQRYTYYSEGELEEKKINSVTDTLVTKIILGTFGCTLAYDRYVTLALRKTGVCGTLGKKSLGEVAKVLRENKQSIEDVITKNKLDKRLYTPVKVLDMYFFELGLEIDK